uniref:GNAT family N-acetyltransferase n=1 Tax=Halomonas sp. TaxID=1486246 RepID=UPI00262B429E|nr:GNAT family N-acetyltransferase [Halomonas sp.]
MSQFVVTRISRIAEVPPLAWNALAGDDHPFVRHEFLHALEASGAVGPGTGWEPQHLTLWQGDVLVGALPFYRKLHSWGEYVFDWAWADAWQRAGGHYYPKGVSAIPFTPAPGPRLLLAEGVNAAEAVTTLAKEWENDDRLSSWHLLFADEGEVAQWRQACPGLIPRRGVQFQWRDQGYADFDDFLAAMTSRRRKEIRRERRRIRDQGLVLRRLCGDEICPDDIRHFFSCYRLTYLERGQQGYLNEDFFQLLRTDMPGTLVLIQALHQGKPVAAALCLQGAHSLYGRYWGSEVMADCLHFETCYYQGIEHCLANGLTLFDPGTQGEHKVARGFAPRMLTSLHYIADPQFADAVARFCREEAGHVAAYSQSTMDGLPFRSSL